MLKCDTCGGAFGSRAELVLHERQQVRLEPSFRCSSCGATFWFLNELRRHAHKVSAGRKQLKGKRRFGKKPEAYK